MAEQSQQHASPGVVSSIALRVELFFGFWFGSSRFDKSARPDFDPADIAAYRAAKGHRLQHLKKNFRRRGAQVTAAQLGEPAAAQQHVAPEQHAAEQPAEPQQPAEPEQREVPADANGEQAPVAANDQPSPPVVEDYVAQWHPKFVFMQIFVCAVLWLIFVIRGDYLGEGPEHWSAGLDSFSPGSTDLSWAGPNCEDHRGQVYRWVSYQFTHLGFWHLFCNAFTLFFLGVPLEGYRGSVRIAVVFNVGIIAGALVYLVLESHRMMFGFSSGCFALLGMHYQALIVNWKETPFRYEILSVLLILTFSQVFVWATGRDFSKLDMSTFCNLGGLLAGFIFSPSIVRNFEVSKCERIFGVMLACVGIALLVFAVTWIGIHQAPINIFEAARGEEGYCWYRQAYNFSMNATHSLCVRCSDASCIDAWSLKADIYSVVLDECRAQGWFYDGR